ncbi:SWI-SNF-Ssr4 domain-containing protein [Pyrenophora tritici-repentis]|nr:SWI-SNF-Ssr4 domain-containing protein [Pyrenophora tritici-repentis]
MMYSGITLTTASLTFSVSGAGPSLAPGLLTGSPGGLANSTAASRLTNAPPLPDATESRAESATGPPSPNLTPGAAVPSSLASAASDGTQAMGSVLETSSSAVTAVPTSAADGSDGPVFSSVQLTVSPSASDIGENGQSVNDAATSTPPTGLSTGIEGSGAPVITTAPSNAPGMTSLAAFSSGGDTLAQTDGVSKPTSMVGAPASATAGLYRPTGGLDASQENNTVSLSPSSVDALQLALVLKNLGVLVFNESRVVELRSLRARGDTDGLASLVAEISVQEQTQLRTLRSLLRRSGNPDVPSCQYDLPSNVTELSFLMGTLKSINLGVFMSMAESADGPVAILLSSIASVDAKHIALLGDYTHRNASGQSFDTPATPAWAYNFALEYIRPGTCRVELPLPILPKLMIDKKTSGHVRPGTNVSVGWDAAARSAVARSGNPVFVAWVNQVAKPVFTALTLFDESSGSTSVPLGLSGTAFAVLTAQPELTSIADLTDATLAGPVVVSSQL